MTQERIDTLTTNIQLAIKDSMKSGLEAITTYQQDSIYDLESIQSDKLPKGTGQPVRFDYSGKNILSRIVRRKADLTVFRL